MRPAWYVVLVLATAAPAAAQDMPRSQVLFEGEGWRPADKGAAPPPGPVEAARPRGGSRTSRKALHVPALTHPAGITLWPDEGTMVIGDAGDRFLWAFRVE